MSQEKYLKYKVSGDPRDHRDHLVSRDREETEETREKRELWVLAAGMANPGHRETREQQARPVPQDHPDLEGTLPLRWQVALMRSLVALSSELCKAPWDLWDQEDLPDHPDPLALKDSKDLLANPERLAPLALWDQGVHLAPLGNLVTMAMLGNLESLASVVPQAHRVQEVSPGHPVFQVSRVTEVTLG